MYETFSKTIWDRAIKQRSNYLIFWNKKGGIVMHRHGDRIYWVRKWEDNGVYTCTCPDYFTRHRLCKHIAMLVQAKERSKQNE